MISLVHLSLSPVLVVFTSLEMGAKSKLSDSEYAMIVSAICFFRIEGETIGDKRYPVYQKVHECLGRSLSTVKRCATSMKEDEENEGPRKKQRVGMGRPKIQPDEFTLGAIRRSIHSFYIAKTFPSIKSLHQKLIDSLPGFPTMSTKTLLNIVKSIGFSFKKLNKKPVLMESLTVSASRHSYLRKIKNLRSEGYKIFYTDETWCNQNHTVTHCWQENVVEALNQQFNNYDQYRGHIQQIYGWRGGFKTPSGAGKRIIILHIGSEEGFLNGAELCFIGKKNTGDYHNEMNSSHYEEWFEKVLRLLPQRSAVVIDQAPYHTMVDPATKNPNMSWRKDRIISWILTKNIPLPTDIIDFNTMTKAELIVHAKPYFGIPEKKLDQIINRVRPDVKLVWLPVAHCELNPIELIWAYVKNKVAKINMSNQAEKGRSMEVMNTLCQEALRSVTPELWKKCVEHAEKIEKRYWEEDQLTEDIPRVEPVIINLNDSSSEESSGSEYEID